MFPSKEIVESVRQKYPVGSRVELLRMDDPQAPPSGTLGTVRAVDDIASVCVQWDNGSTLNVVYGQDLCRVATPETPPGSTLTLVLEDGEWRQVGPIPKIDPKQIPKYAMDNLCRTLLDSVRKAFQDPKVVAEYEAWKKARDEGKAKGKEAP